MNKNIYIICAIFALIISCKNYASGKNGEDIKKQVKGFLDTKKEELVEGFEKLGAEVQPKDGELMQADEPQEQGEGQVAQGVSEGSDLKVINEINKKLEELTKKINEANDKTPIGTYYEYDKEIKDLRKKLKNLNLQNEGKQKEEKDKLEKQLEGLVESLKNKKETRKKSLEEVKEKLNKFKEQIVSASGESLGDAVKKQGGIGLQAWKCVNPLGLGINMDNETDSNELANKVIENSLKKIEEELNNTKENAIENKKE
ncbi:hypothetical protein QIA45_05560 (plasmid) [Borreliella andersonii]|uniref:Uncharacterized protein n=1 Tax=Borrelia andersonii TaxID=42109 RepID=A0ACD5G8Q7_BORAD